MRSFGMSKANHSGQAFGHGLPYCNGNVRTSPSATGISSSCGPRCRPFSTVRAFAPADSPFEHRFIVVLTVWKRSRRTRQMTTTSQRALQQAVHQHFSSIASPKSPAFSEGCLPAILPSRGCSCTRHTRTCEGNREEDRERFATSESTQREIYPFPSTLSCYHFADGEELTSLLSISLVGSACHHHLFNSFYIKAENFGEALMWWKVRIESTRRCKPRMLVTRR